MKLDVPDGFIEFVKGIGKYFPPSTVIEILKWASEKPDVALRVVEEAKKLNETGRRAFECNLLAYKPDEALKGAFEWQERERERRSWLSKVIVHARRGGFRFKTASGVDCEIRSDKCGYVFRFNPGGVEVLIHHAGRFLADTVEDLIKNGVFSGGYGISGIILNEKMYSRDDDRGKAILRAIEENVNPYVYMVVS